VENIHHEILACYTVLLSERRLLVSENLQPDRTPETPDRLRQTFDRWRDITISDGEELGTFT
jgi:hypothetical protein